MCDLQRHTVLKSMTHCSINMSCWQIDWAALPQNVRGTFSPWKFSIKDLKVPLTHCCLRFYHGLKSQRVYGFSKVCVQLILPYAFLFQISFIACTLLPINLATVFLPILMNNKTKMKTTSSEQNLDHIFSVAERFLQTFRGKIKSLRKWSLCNRGS